MVAEPKDGRASDAVLRALFDALAFGARSRGTVRTASPASLLTPRTRGEPWLNPGGLGGALARARVRGGDAGRALEWNDGRPPRGRVAKDAPRAPAVGPAPRHAAHGSPIPAVGPTPRYAAHGSPIPVGDPAPRHAAHGSPIPVGNPAPRHAAHGSPIPVGDSAPRYAHTLSALARESASIEPWARAHRWPMAGSRERRPAERARNDRRGAAASASASACRSPSLSPSPSPTPTPTPSLSLSLPHHTEAR